MAEKTPIVISEDGTQYEPLAPGDTLPESMISVIQTDGITLTGSGTSSDPLRIVYTIQPQEGNIASINALGVGAQLVMSTSEHITLHGLGSQSAPLSVSLKISNENNNAITLKTDGFYVEKKAGFPATPVVAGYNVALSYTGSVNEYSVATLGTTSVYVSLKSTYTSLVAAGYSDEVHLVISPTTGFALTGGTVVGRFITAYAGIALVGASQTIGGSLSAVIPKGWYFALRRVSGTRVTIESTTAIQLAG